MFFIIILCILFNLKVKNILDNATCDKDRDIAEKVHGISFIVIFILIYDMMWTSFLETLILCIVCSLFASYKKTKIVDPNVTFIGILGNSLINLVKVFFILIVVVFLVLSCCMLII